MNTKKIILVVISIIVLFSNIFILSKKTEKIKTDIWSTFDTATKKSRENILETGDETNQIAVLSLDDVIQAGKKHEHFMESLETIRNSENVKAVIIKIDSPGGGVYEAVQMAEKINQIKKEKKIPFYASMGSIAASGGYYVASVCDKIYAVEETTTGSIGVIMSSMNMTGLYDKLGVKEEVIKSSKFKDIGSSSRQMSAEDRAILQQLIDNAYNKFVKVVAEGRHMSEENVRKIADGRIYDGKQALENHLIDKYGYYEDVLADVKTELKLEEPQVKSYEYMDELDTFMSLFSSVSNIGKSEVQKNLETLNTLRNNNDMKPMYLYGGM